ncbi:hypothetical protein V1477_019424 [Vespula maculifrons]|uniref:CCHC-type domain-containing protein n=1 Tax=Vespula maculifrons TaxID=7453 RepID=A0ABD2ASI2_VESMC
MISSNLLPKTCTYCKKLGHIKKECYKFKREQQIQSEENPPLPPQSSPLHLPLLYINYDPTPINIDHNIDECRKKLWHDKNSERNDKNSEKANNPPRKGAPLEANQQQRPTITITADVLSTFEHFINRYLFKRFKTKNDVFSRQGFEPNILKINKAVEYLLCEEINKIIPNGIIEETITTYGSCIVDMYGHPVEFYVVPNSFPFFEADFFRNSLR